MEAVKLLPLSGGLANRLQCVWQAAVYCRMCVVKAVSMPICWHSQLNCSSEAGQHACLFPGHIFTTHHDCLSLLEVLWLVQQQCKGDGGGLASTRRGLQEQRQADTTAGRVAHTAHASRGMPTCTSLCGLPHETHVSGALGCCLCPPSQQHTLLQLPLLPV